MPNETLVMFRWRPFLVILFTLHAGLLDYYRCITFPNLYPELSFLTFPSIAGKQLTDNVTLEGMFSQHEIEFYTQLLHKLCLSTRNVSYCSSTRSGYVQVRTTRSGRPLRHLARGDNPKSMVTTSEGNARLIYIKYAHFHLVRKFSNFIINLSELKALQFAYYYSIATLSCCVQPLVCRSIIIDQ